MNAKPIEILLVEDNPGDVLLVMLTIVKLPPNGKQQ